MTRHPPARRARTLFRIVLAASAALLGGYAAVAQPPATCRERFVGLWTYPGGETEITADGKADPDPGGTQYWTCEGNRYLFSNSPDGTYEYSMVLAPDGQTLSGVFGTARRVGGGGNVPATRTGGKMLPEAETCTVRVEQAPSTVCVGTAETCACLTAVNGCPYPVSVSFRLGGVRKHSGLSLKPSGTRGERDTICATRDAGQSISPVGWKPNAGYPKPGQPKPARN